jgi:cell division protein FtsL
MVSKEAVLELKRDLSLIKRYIKYLFVILFFTGLTIFYNSQYFKIEKEITLLTKQKSYLIAENMQLRKEKAVLSSPERIYKIATQKLDMKKVDLKNVYFLSNE